MGFLISPVSKRYLYCCPILRSSVKPYAAPNSIDFVWPLNELAAIESSGTPAAQQAAYSRSWALTSFVASSKHPCLFAVDHQQHDSGNDYREACPVRNEGRFLFGDRKSERPELAFMRFLGVFEVAVKQAKKARDQQHDPEYFGGA